MGFKLIFLKFIFSCVFFKCKMKNLWFLFFFQIDEDDIDDVGEMKKQEFLNRYIVNVLFGICNLLKKDIILYVVKVYNFEYLMGSK